MRWPFLVAALLVCCGACDSSSLGSSDGSPDARDSSVADVRDGTVDGPGTPALDADREASTDAPSGSDGPAGTDAPSGSDAPVTGSRWLSLQAPIGASIGALAFGPEGNLYAGGRSSGSTQPASGIFVSSDDGVSWKPINEGMGDFTIGALHATAKSVFAGVGTLMRSDDKGATWTACRPAASRDFFDAIGGQGDVVVAGESFDGSLWRSSDGGLTFTQSPFTRPASDLAVLGSVVLLANSGGLTRSTDGAATFSTVAGTGRGEASVRCDGVKTCYATAHGVDEFSPRILLKSTDAGATWAPTGRLGLRVLAFSDSGIVYVANATSTRLVIDRSDDGGATWTTVERPAPKLAPTYPCEGPLVAKGDKVFSACHDGVYRSDDRGANWNWAGGSFATGAITGSASRAFADTSATALGPNGDLYLLRNVRSRMLRSSDDGKTWQELDVPVETQGCIATERGSIQCLNGRYNFLRSEDHGTNWREFAVNPPGTPAGTQKAVHALARQGAVMYAAGTALLRSDDDGLTFQVLPDPPFPVSNLQVLRNGHLLASTLLDLEVARSTDGGMTWKVLVRPLPRLPVLQDQAGHLISAGPRGALMKSTDEGDTWTPIASASLALDHEIRPLGADGSERFYLVQAGRLSVSDDQGATWTRLAEQPPHRVVTSFLTDKPGRLLAVTTGGVYRLER